MRLNEYFADSSINKILLSGLFAAIGAGFGAFAFQLLSNKKTLIKIMGLFSLSAISVFLFVAIAKFSQPNYLTCEICGYKSFEEKSQECLVCENSTWEIEKKDNIYHSKKEWIKEEQLFWFGFEDSTQFFSPFKVGKFEKDKTWKPQITEFDLASDTL